MVIKETLCAKAAAADAGKAQQDGFVRQAESCASHIIDELLAEVLIADDEDSLDLRVDCSFSMRGASDCVPPTAGAAQPCTSRFGTGEGADLRNRMKAIKKMMVPMVIHVATPAANSGCSVCQFTGVRNTRCRQAGPAKNCG